MKGLQANKLVWHSFVGAGRRLRSRVRHKRLSFTHRNSPSITFLSGSQAPVPTGQSKEDQVTPVHAEGHITGEESWAQGTQVVYDVHCFIRRQCLPSPSKALSTPALCSEQRYYLFFIFSIIQTSLENIPEKKTVSISVQKTQKYKQPIENYLINTFLQTGKVKWSPHLLLTDKWTRPLHQWVRICFPNYLSVDLLLFLFLTLLKILCKI